MNATSPLDLLRLFGKQFDRDRSLPAPRRAKKVATTTQVRGPRECQRSSDADFDGQCDNGIDIINGQFGARLSGHQKGRETRRPRETMYTQGICV